MQIFNGTPVPIKARAEGVPYVFMPGQIVDIPEARGATVLNNFPMMRQVRVGDDMGEVAEECLAAWCAHVETQVREYNQFQLEQAKQGLKLAPPHKQLEAFSKLVEEKTGQALKLDDDKDGGDTVLGLIRSLSMTIKRIKEDTPEKQKLAALLDELVKQKGDKHHLVEEKRQALLDGSDLRHTVPAALKARRAGRIRGARVAAAKE